MNYWNRSLIFFIIFLIFPSNVFSKPLIEVTQAELAFLKGRALTQLPRTDMAEFNICMNTAKSLLPDDDEGLLYLSMCYQKVGDYPGAVSTLQKIPVNSNHYILSVMEMAKIFRGLKDMANETKCYERIIQLDPENKFAGIELSMRYLESQQYKKANKILEKLNQKYPDSKEIRQLYNLSKSGQEVSKKNYKKILDIGYSYSNTKPGYMLLQNEGSDYELTSLRTKVFLPLSQNTFARGSHIRNGIEDSGSETFNSTETGLELIHRLNFKEQISGGVNFLTLTDENTEFEGHLKYKKLEQNKVIGLDFGRLTYAVDRNSFSAPANYLQFRGTFGVETSKELYFEIIPGVQYYSEDENTKAEIMAILSYTPLKNRKLSIDAMYKMYMFTKNFKEDGTDFVYFSPASGSNMYLGMMYKLNFFKSSDLSFGGSIKNTQYEVNDLVTEYYTIGCSVNSKLSFSKNVSLNLGYNFSISQSDGFPASQDMSANLQVKF